MLRNDYIAILQARLKALVDFNSPTSFLERYVVFLAYLQWCSVVPTGQEAGFALLMETIVNRDFVQASGSHEFLQVGDGIRFFETVGEQAIKLSLRVEEVVVWVDDDDCCVGRHDEVDLGDVCVVKAEDRGREECFIDRNRWYRMNEALTATGLVSRC